LYNKSAKSGSSGVEVWLKQASTALLMLRQLILCVVSGVTSNTSNHISQLPVRRLLLLLLLMMMMMMML